ncbi:uncharacterized protein BO80DRAFT_70335 [Aspergillus ibericus CBS 121593]|uniref:Uncharacterized protein n=1 Tax=Aspergillus ibericus CBS 121593 TaxID=1448316 RepID=A0A395H4H5_9EURO|nr:hypothetical protein BO80DRAFT_70335 [Aspergillus ibericus CBS 121593]RAL01114.1 hypothetical protein BO80DRAFT_70335 [Aspergillus ibericus CBS 121593]
MGNNNSLVHSEVPLKLKELSEVVLSAGDHDTARILEQISSSQELIKSWHTKLISNDCAKGNSLAGSEMGKWFQVWKNDKGRELSDDQVCRLAALTKNRRRRSQQDIPKRLFDWIRDPVLKFWGQKALPQSTQLIDCCLHDVDETENSSLMSPIRRRVILVILHDLIQREKKHLQDLASQRKTRSHGHPNSGQGKKFLTEAISNIINRTYYHLNLSQDVLDQKRKRCTELQRYGGKWSLFGRREAILEFPMPYAANNFERAKLEVIEIEALNAYEESMYDQGYRSKLRDAYNAIYDAYMSRRCNFPVWPYHPDNTKSLTTVPDDAHQKRLRNNPEYTDERARKRPALITSRHQEGDVQNTTPPLRSINIGDPTIRVQSGCGNEADNRVPSAPILIERNSPQLTQLSQTNGSGPICQQQTHQRLVNKSQSGRIPTQLPRYDVQEQPHRISVAEIAETCSAANRETPGFPSCRQADIPHPEPADARATTTMMASSEEISHQQPSDVPQPDATDAWATATFLASSGGFSHQQSSDVPQPSETDAWAATEIMSHVGGFSHSPTTIPQPDASDAWAATEMMRHLGGFPHPSSTIPQPDATDAWATATVLASSGDFSHQPSTPGRGAKAVRAATQLATFLWSGHHNSMKSPMIG